MRGSWLEVLCLLTLSVATLSLHGRDTGPSFLTLPMLAGSKATVIAATAPARDPARNFVIATRSDMP